MEITLSALSVLLTSLAAAMVAAATVSGVSWKIAKPHIERWVLSLMNKNHGKRIEKLEAEYAEHEEKKVSDHKRLTKMEIQNKAILKALLVMLLHMRDSNHTGEMGEVIKELQIQIIDS